MVVLSEKRIKTLLESSVSNSNLVKAKKQEDRIRMHTLPILDKSEQTQAHLNWIERCRNILVAEKFETFCSLIPYPLPTNEITETIFQEFPRILKSKNRFIKLDLSSDKLNDDANDFIDKISFWDFWNGKGINALSENINSFIIIDLPEKVNETSFPEPYFYLLPIEDVIDVSITNDSVDYIVFSLSLDNDELDLEITEKRAIIDSEKYLVHTRSKNGAWIEKVNSPHDLGFCPACKYFPKSVSEKNPVNSKSPLSSALGDLDTWLFDKISIEYFKLYGTFPIYWAYENKCDYVDPNTGGECDGNGNVVWTDQIDGQINGNRKTSKCPKCSKKDLLGAGSIFTVAPPQMQGDVDLRNPIGKIDIQVELLEHLENKLSTTESQIIYNCTGKAKETVINSTAVNKDQVMSSFETRQQIIDTLARTIEKTIWFTLDTLAKLRYGKFHSGTTVDLGSEFFLKSTDDLLKEYKTAKDSGMPEFALSQKRDFIFSTESQGNPEMFQRYEILKSLEPFQGLSLKELKDLGFDEKNRNAFILKSNFSYYIEKFEREEMNILSFGNLLQFKDKISKIQDILNQYIKQDYGEIDRQELSSTE